MKYVIIGSSISGNKGAAAMLEASIQTISKQDHRAKFTLFSVYPAEDSRQNRFKNLSIIPTGPLTLALWVNPLALFLKILPPLRPLLSRQRHLKAILESDVYLDQGGITFVDGRSLFLLYNVASILPPLLLGKPVVKCSQALGPFNSPGNRFFAKILLPKMAKILARGKQTLAHLNSLRLTNVELAADYAFALQLEQTEIKHAIALMAKLQIPTKGVVGICPSQVVRKKIEKRGGNYSKILSDYINSLNQTGKRVVLLAHSARGGAGTHNNDLPICRSIFTSINDKGKCWFIDQELTPQQLRYIISTLDACIVSRFHAMISALAVSTPVAVVGWSHKYSEVLEEFGQSEYAIDLSRLSDRPLEGLLERVLKNRRTIADTITKNLPRVINSAQINTAKILEIAEGGNAN